MYVALDLPWGVKHPDVKYWKDRKIHVYNGPLLPPSLKQYKVPEFSYAKWQEDELNGSQLPPTLGKTRFTPRPHQLEAAKKILKAYKQGWPGFLEADKTGLGKGLASSTPIPTPNGFTTMGRVEVGDFIYGVNGKPTKVIGKYRSKASRFFKMTFSDGSIVYADEDHRWVTQNHQERNQEYEQALPFLKLSKKAQEKLNNYLLEAQEKRLGITLQECLEYSNRENEELVKGMVTENPSYGTIDGYTIYHPQEVLESLHRRGGIENYLGESNRYASVKTTIEILDSLYLPSGGFNHSIKSSKFQEIPYGAGAKQDSTDRYIINIEEVEKEEEYYCISVDAPDHLYLITESYLHTHNTLSTIAGLTLIAASRGYDPTNKAKVLIICPKNAIPQWRNTFKSYPIALAHLRPLIINYQQLNKLLEPPATAKNAAKKRTKERQTARQGKSAIDWQFIVADESHNLKNFPKSLQSQAFVSLGELKKPYKKGVSPFIIYVTATPGSSPLNFAVMSPWLSRLIDTKLKKPVLPKDWGQFLHSQGFNVKKGKNGWTWGSPTWFGKNSKNPEERARHEKAVRENKKRQRDDARRIGQALKHNQAPFIMRSPSDIAGWPEQQIIPLPLEMSNRQWKGYQEAWTAFRKWLRLTPAHSDPKGALVETLRYRQKTSLLKVESIIENVVDAVETGNQVYISVQFLDSLDKFREMLEKKKIKVGEISGRVTGEDREKERIKFQKGEYDVMLSTVVDTISLHQDETLPDGSKATSNPRITIIHDVRQNDLETVQALGRAHRDGVNSTAFFPYFEKTVDEKIVDSFTNKNANLKSMLGEENAEELESLFRSAVEEYK